MEACYCALCYKSHPGQHNTLPGSASAAVLQCKLFGYLPEDGLDSPPKTAISSELQSNLAIVPKSAQIKEFIKYMTRPPKAPIC